MSIPRSIYLIILLTLAPVGNAQILPRYSVTNLGPGTALAINDSGVVTGGPGTSRIQAWIYRNGIRTTIGNLGGSDGWGAAINSAGHVAGRAYTQGDSSLHGFIYKNGVLADLGIQSQLVFATGINAFDEIAGYASVVGAFSWTSGGFTILPQLSGGAGEVFGINDSGHIVGFSSPTGGPYHAVVYKNGGLVDLGTFGGANTQATAINNKDQIVIETGGNAILYDNGITTDLGVNGIPTSINDSGTIVGVRTAAGANHAWIWKNGSWADLNTLIKPQGSLNFYLAYGINNHGQIVGQSFAGEAILLSETLSVYAPSGGKRWVVDEQDTIKWSGPQKNGWEIFLSSDNGAHFAKFDTKLLPNARALVWTPPDTLVTGTRYRIKVQDILDPSYSAESDSFTIRAYDLVRKVQPDSLEVFTPPRHGWFALNIDTTMWPPGWYQQFDYRAGTDPFTGNTYEVLFAPTTHARPENFPDWPLFVETFGVEKCYVMSGATPVRIKGRAAEIWSLLKDPVWEGACFGFSTTALLAFDASSAFFQQNPAVTPSATIFDLATTDGIRNTINKYYLYQFDAVQLEYNYSNRATTDPRKLLDDVKEMLLNDDGPHSTLAMRSHSEPSSHDLVPYKLIRDNSSEGVYKLFLYDENNPGETTIYVSIDSLGDTWEEFTGVGYPAADSGLYLDAPVTRALERPILELLEASSPAASPTAQLPAIPAAAANQTWIFPGNRFAHIFIVDGNGDSTGYGGGRDLRQISASHAIEPATARLRPPIAYTVPPGSQYTMHASAFTDTLYTALIATNGELYHYERSDASSSQSDRLTLSSGIAVTNDDPDTKKILLRSISTISDSEEILYEVGSIAMGHGDSDFVAQAGSNQFEFLHDGSPAAYSLKVRNVSPAGKRDFQHDAIAINSTATHWITVRDTSFATMTILIDNGNDGTIDDSLVVGNEVTSIADQRPLGIPKDFSLEQNYPNPFNPNTTIRFRLPVSSRVTLNVYNTLGQVVTSLVNNIEAAGYKSVEWNAGNIASGVYICRLEAISVNDPSVTFLQVMKMLIIR